MLSYLFYFIEIKSLAWRNSSFNSHKIQCLNSTFRFKIIIYSYYGNRFLIKFSSFRIRPLSAEAVKDDVTLLAVCLIVEAIEFSLADVFMAFDIVEPLPVSMLSLSFSNGFVDCGTMSFGAIRLYSSSKYVESERRSPFISMILLNSICELSGNSFKYCSMNAWAGVVGCITTLITISALVIPLTTTFE